MRNPALGGGALLDLGVYPVSLAHLLLGVPQHVQAWAKLSPEGVDENTGIVLGYDSGAVATLSCGMVGATPLTAAITGTTGRIELPEPFFRPGSAVLHRADAEPETLTDDPAGGGYQYEAAEVQRCLAAGADREPAGAARRHPGGDGPAGRHPGPDRGRLRLNGRRRGTPWPTARRRVPLPTGRHPGSGGASATVRTADGPPGR